MQEIRVTVFPSLLDTTTSEVLTINQIVDRIKNGNSKKIIDLVRQGNKDIKNLLPCIMFSGLFEIRKKEGLKEKTGLICLDFDNVKNPQEFKDILTKDPYTFICFISPSGTGVKQVIKVNKEGDHIKIFRSLQEKYPEVDDKAKDISRICYESYDPDIFVNEESLTWYQEKKQEIRQPVKSIQDKTESETVRNLITWFTKNYSMEEGSRNNNLFILACALFEFGINDPLPILQEFSNGLSESEVKTITNSAYQTTLTKGSIGSKRFEDDIKTVVLKPLNKIDQPREITINPDLITGETVQEVIEHLYNIKFNTITQRVEINGQDITDGMYHIIFDNVNTFIKRNTGRKKELNKSAFDAGFALASNNNQYNALTNFFDFNTWDKTPRLQEFLSCFHDQYNQSPHYLMKWLIGAIEKIHNPYFQNEVLVLEGSSGIGKTRTVALIAQPFIRYTRFGGALNPDNKDHKLELTNNFIYEWGEGSNISKRSEDSLKELLTASYITERLPFARFPVTKPVTASIVMTKNSGTFLRDDAEKRRFNILYLTQVDKKIINHDFDMVQIWAEVYEMWLADKTKTWNYVDDEVKNKIFESAMDRPAVWELLDKIVSQGTEHDAFTLQDLNTEIEKSVPKWDRDRMGNRKDVRAYFKRLYNVEPKKSRACSELNENPFFCIHGLKLKSKKYDTL